MSSFEITAADLWATAVITDVHPLRYLREHLTARGAITTAAVGQVADGSRVWVGGAVTHRQRPGTAGGITFLNLEDETGMLNIVISPGLFLRTKKVLNASAALLIRGTVQAHQGVVSVIADQLTAIDMGPVASPSRNYR